MWCSTKPQLGKTAIKATKLLGVVKKNRQQQQTALVVAVHTAEQSQDSGRLCGSAG